MNPQLQSVQSVGNMHYTEASMFKLIHSFIVIFIQFKPSESVSINSSICARSVAEYLVPKAEQTHEILCVLDENMLLITQFSNSKLLKAKTSPENGAITDVAAFVIGNEASGLHGLAESSTYRNNFWVSLEKDNKLILLDPRVGDINAEPECKKTISIPTPGNGPHHIAEYGNNLWATLKASEHVLRINHKNPKDYQFYNALPTPVFLAQHPVSEEIYVSEYKSNTILRINPVENITSRVQVPVDVGESPMGIVSNGNFTWVTLLSIKSKGMGSFGKIFANGSVEWFRLKTRIGRRSALLHLAFDPHALTDARPGIWLLASSAEDPGASDMMLKIHFDKNFEKFDSEEMVFLPSQGIKAHRLATCRLGVYATELVSSTVAYYERTKNASCDYAYERVELRGDEL